MIRLGTGLRPRSAIRRRGWIAAGRPETTGSALLITLVLLGVVTCIGITGLTGVVLQERFAHSHRHGTRVFAITAAALRRCEMRVLAGASAASGMAAPAMLDRFRRGLAKAPVVASMAEYVRPGWVARRPMSSREAGYRVACLIQFNGPLDAVQVGDSLRIAPGGAVVYTILASGARAVGKTGGHPRPAVILESRVVMRR